MGQILVKFIFNLFFSGGSALYIEASLSRRLRPSQATTTLLQSPTGDVVQPQQNQQQPVQGSLEVTGHLGDVMKVQFGDLLNPISYF